MCAATYNQACSDSVEDLGPGHFMHQCNSPSKATRYQKDHTYPNRVCGIHARVAERMGMPVVWDRPRT